MGENNWRNLYLMRLQKRILITTSQLVVGSDMNRYFFKDDTQMSDEYVQRY